MTDDQHGPTDHLEDEDGSTMSEPGGGPKKVVSETSVDDILNSLEEPTQSTADRPDRTATEPAAADSNPEPELDADQDPNPEIDPLEEPTPRTTAETTSEEPEPTDTEDRTNDSTTQPQPQPSSATGDDEQSLEDAISALEETESADATLTDVLEEAGGERNEDLAERIEAGTVTGADVRAAEAGKGREPTPDVDEIDLSLDDLETSTPPTGAPGENTNADTETTTDDESSGVLSRLKRLFSG